MNILNNFRQTGRTTRMFQHVTKIAAVTEEPICIIIHRKEQIDSMMFRSDIKFPRNVKIFSFDDVSHLLNLITLNCQGFKPQYTFIDHAIIEVIFARHAEFLHRYDQTLRLVELDTMEIMKTDY